MLVLIFVLYIHFRFNFYFYRILCVLFCCYCTFPLFLICLICFQKLTWVFLLLFLLNFFFLLSVVVAVFLFFLFLTRRVFLPFQNDLAFAIFFALFLAGRLSGNGVYFAWQFSKVYFKLSSTTNERRTDRASEWMGGIGCTDRKAYRHCKKFIAKFGRRFHVNKFECNF